MNEENNKLFWYWVAERQNIWYKRYILKQSAPWTEDKILQNYSFTNVYRYLDRNTLFLMKTLKEHKQDNPKDIIFNIFVFRMFNRIDTYQEIGWQTMEGFNRDEMIKILEAKEQRDGCSVFTKAYMTTGLIFPNEHNKIRKYTLTLQQIKYDYENLFSVIFKSDNNSRVFNYILKYDGIGKFLSQQFCIDFSYTPFVDYTDDQWTYIQAGAEVGLKFIFPETKKSQYLIYAEHLRDVQEAQFVRLNLNFIKYKNKKISLNNIENCLCEFSKYFKFSVGGGKRRKYKKNQEELIYDL